MYVMTLLSKSTFWKFRTNFCRMIERTFLFCTIWKKYTLFFLKLCKNTFSGLRSTLTFFSITGDWDLSNFISYVLFLTLANILVFSYYKSFSSFFDVFYIAFSNILFEISLFYLLLLSIFLFYLGIFFSIRFHNQSINFNNYFLFLIKLYKLRKILLIL